VSGGAGEEYGAPYSSVDFLCHKVASWVFSVTSSGTEVMYRSGEIWRGCSTAPSSSSVSFEGCGDDDDNDTVSSSQLDEILDEEVARVNTSDDNDCDERFGFMNLPVEVCYCALTLNSNSKQNYLL